MWLPISISRTSLVLVLLGAAVSSHPESTRPAAIRPDASVTFAIEAEIYQDYLEERLGSVTKMFGDSLVVLLREEYGFTHWGPSESASYRLNVRLVNPDPSDDPQIAFRLEGPEDTTTWAHFQWEVLDSAWEQPSWDTAAVMGKWGRLLREVQEDWDVQLEERVLAALPLGVQAVLRTPNAPQLPFKAVVPVHLDSIRADSSPDPQFLVHAILRDTDPDTASESALLHLRGCSLGPGYYVCRIRGLVTDEDSLWTEAEVARELGQQGRSIEFRSVHLWRFYPVQVDPRSMDDPLVGGQ